MAQQKKIRIVVLYGGRSGEHEVSLRSAASVVRNLDRNRYEIIPVAIDKQGRWLLQDLNLIEKDVQVLPVSPAYQGGRQIELPPHPETGENRLQVLGQGAPGIPGVDVVFPVMHGPLCEDGTIQGLLELADVAYVGCGVLSSAVGMDKTVAKRLAASVGIPIVPSLALKYDALKRGMLNIESEVRAALGFPVFVKPANQGSSVGVHKVKEAAGLESALRDAFRYDTKVLVEKFVSAREIEVSVLENIADANEPLVSIPGEIIPTHEFYSYEAKYLDENGAALSIPAKLSAEQVAYVQRIARDAFLALECEGMARVDLFLDKSNGNFYFNEVNTIPGFTSISMYPKMWEASGIGYQDLLTRLIDLALARHYRKHALVREFHQD